MLHFGMGIECTSHKKSVRLPTSGQNNRAFEAETAKVIE